MCVRPTLRGILPDLTSVPVKLGRSPWLPRPSLKRRQRLPFRLLARTRLAQAAQEELLAVQQGAVQRGSEASQFLCVST